MKIPRTDCSWNPLCNEFASPDGSAAAYALGTAYESLDPRRMDQRANGHLDERRSLLVLGPC